MVEIATPGGRALKASRIRSLVAASGFRMGAMERHQQDDFSRWQGVMVRAGSPPLGIQGHVRPAARADRADRDLSPRPKPGLQFLKASKQVR